MYSIKKNCLNCGKEFFVAPTRKNVGKNCSWKCRIEYTKEQLVCAWCGKKYTRVKSINKRILKQNPDAKFYCCKSHQISGIKFKGGYISHGYKILGMNGKEIREHRMIMENHLGRKLNPKEHIHHINHNKLDNRIENLQLMSIQEHGSLEGKRGGRPKKYV